MEGFLSARIAACDRKAGYEAALRAYFGDEYVDKHVRVQISEPEAFTASIEPLALGHVRGAVHTSNAAHSLYLAPSDTSCQRLDFYLLLSGEISFEGDAGDVHLRSGDMALMRASDAFSSASSQMEMIVLSFPEHLLPRHTASRPPVLNRAVSGLGALGACLGSLLRTAAQRQRDLSFEEGLLLQSSVLETAMYLARSGGDEIDRPVAGQEEKLGVLQRCAMSLIANPNLSPQHVATDAGVSVRTVHRLFNLSGVTFRDWVRERRLERCWEELMDPAKARRTVADIAFRWGFNDLTTFNRSFRAKYGAAPTVLRTPGR